MPKQKLILIIDDSESDRRIYRRYLGPDFLVEEAPTAAAGLAAIRAHAPDVILLDFRLPDMDGLATLSAIRPLTECPVIFITGNPEVSLATNAFRAGAVSYLSKDLLSREKLVELVSQAAGMN